MALAACGIEGVKEVVRQGSQPPILRVRWHFRKKQESFQLLVRLPDHSTDPTGYIYICIVYSYTYEYIYIHVVYLQGSRNESVPLHGAL